MILSGTVQEIRAELIKINPTYVQDYPAMAARDQSSIETNEGTMRLHKRDVKCYRSRDASRDAIEEGIRYLRGVKGRPHLGPGPNKCTRVSCSWDSGIW